MQREKPKNHLIEKQVRNAVIKIVAGMFIFIILPAVYAVSVIVNNGKPLQVGASAPLFDLVNQNESHVKARDLYTEWSYVYFYNGQRFESVGQAKCYREHYRDFDQMKLHLVGIGYDSVDVHHEFAEKLKLSHDLLSDPEGDIIDDFAAYSSMNHMTKNIGYLIDDHGIVQKVYQGLVAEQLVEQLSHDMHALRNL